MKSQFSTGWVLGGHHKDIRAAPVHYSQTASIWRSSATMENPQVAINAVRMVIPNSYEVDDIGIKVEPLPTCKTCNVHRQELSRDQQETVQILQSGLHLDTEVKQVTAKYPFNDNVLKMEDNFAQAVKRATSVENGLRRSGNLDFYNQCFQEQLDRGAIGPVLQHELDEWARGGNKFHFISHHPVYKGSSKTTPLRIVCDAAVRNNYHGPSLNMCMPSNMPNSINSLLTVLLRWRSYPVAVVWDLSKAYNSVLTGPHEAFLRLMVWR